MIENNYIEIEYFQRTKYGEDVCGDDFKIDLIDNENRHIAVLSDGLGSGIKASLLANMTTTMALKFAMQDMEVTQSSEIIMDSLPVCDIRKISYATFTIVDTRADGFTRIIEMDNPAFIHLRNNEEVVHEKANLYSMNWPERKLMLSSFNVEPEDRIIFFSDGVTQAGLGTKEYKFGWKRAGCLSFIRKQLQKCRDISAQDLSRLLVQEAAKKNPRYRNPDDITCAVTYFRTPRRLMLLTGPPFKTERDAEYADKLKKFDGKKIVCGGTTACIISRELDRKVTVPLPKTRESLPLPAEMDGIDLVTEGILTLTEAIRILEQDYPPTTVPTAIKELNKLLITSDIIHFIVGTKINEAHQDPNLPVDLEIRRNIVKRLKEILEKKYRKKVTLEYI